MKKCLMLAGAMAEYDAIEDAATEVSSVTRSADSEGRYYMLNGTLASGFTRGVVIRNGEKAKAALECSLYSV